LHVDTGTGFRGGQRQVNLLIHTLASHDIEQYIACPEDGPLAEKTANTVKKQFPLSKSNFMRFLERREIRHFIEDHGINVVHAHDSHAHSIMTLVKAGNSPALVVTRRSSGKIGFGSRTKYLSHNIRYIAISRHIKNLLVEGGVREEDVTVISSMIDIEVFRKAAQNDKPALYRDEPRRIIISGGAFDPDKGFIDAVRAIHRLSRERKDFVYFLYGEGSEFKRLKNYIESNNLDGFIKLPGWQDNPAEYLRGGDVFISPSHTEGLNMSIVDAMASGVPVVVSDIEPHRENVSDNETGLLFRPGDDEGLSKVVGRVLDNRDLAEKLKTGAMEVAERHDCRQVAGRIYDLYREAVAP